MRDPLISISRHHWQYFDWVLFALLLATTAFGLAVVWGTTHHIPMLAGYPTRQALWWAIGLIAFAAVLMVDYAWLRHLALPLYAGTVVLLALLLGLPEHLMVRATRSWLPLPGGFRIQPAEFAKLAVVFVLAREFSERPPATLAPRAQFWQLVKAGVLVGVPMVLIAMQPDLGTAVVFVPVLLLMAFAAGMSRRLLGVLLLGALLSGAAVFPFLKPYQRARLTVHLDPESDARGRGYNIIQAKIALGGGELTGKGLGEGTQSYFGFLPEHHTDFIFNSLGEQLGLVGCLALLGLFVALIWRSLAAAAVARSHFGAHLVVGLTAVFASHVFLNILIAVQILPVTGLPLPLMSVGGSFLLANYITFGLILNVRMRRHHFG